MATVKIQKKELQKMIKEEYSRKITEINLKKRLRQINEEIEEITEEDDLDEVEVGGQEKVRSTAWTGEKGGDDKWSPKFQKKGSHLVEDEETSEDDSFEIDADEMSDEMSNEMSDEEMDIDTILAKLADALEDKIETTIDDKMGSNAEEIDNDAEEIDNDAEEIDNEEPITEQDGISVAQAQTPKNATPYDNGKAEIKALVSEGTKKRMQILSGIVRNPFND